MGLEIGYINLIVGPSFYIKCTTIMCELSISKLPFISITVLIISVKLKIHTYLEVEKQKQSSQSCVSRFLNEHLTPSVKQD